MSEVETVLNAITDPTRRSVLESLRGGPRTVGEIAAGYSVSRPAISQHLRVLSEAGLVTARKVGRNNFYAVDLKGLAILRTYLEGYWDDVFDAFQHAAIKERAKGGRLS
jgi:DNA-binding transcriptional ArsR family regulator